MFYKTYQCFHKKYKYLNFFTQDSLQFTSGSIRKNPLCAQIQSTWSDENSDIPLVTVFADLDGMFRENGLATATALTLQFGEFVLHFLCSFASNFCKAIQLFIVNNSVIVMTSPDLHKFITNNYQLFMEVKEGYEKNF